MAQQMHSEVKRQPLVPKPRSQGLSQLHRLDSSTPYLLRFCVIYILVSSASPESCREPSMGLGIKS